jgi:hypothetical protein
VPEPIKVRILRSPPFPADTVKFHFANGVEMAVSADDALLLENFMREYHRVGTRNERGRYVFGKIGEDGDKTVIGVKLK